MFLEVYINNWWIIVLVYLSCSLGEGGGVDRRKGRDVNGCTKISNHSCLQYWIGTSFMWNNISAKNAKGCWEGCSLVGHLAAFLLSEQSPSVRMIMTSVVIILGDVIILCSGIAESFRVTICHRGLSTFWVLTVVFSFFSLSTCPIVFVFMSD